MICPETIAHISTPECRLVGTFTVFGVFYYHKDKHIIDQSTFYFDFKFELLNISFVYIVSKGQIVPQAI